MPRQDSENRHRGRERGWDVRDLREDYGQADYSRDYRYDRHRRIGVRAEPDPATRDDFGQADFSRDYEYDPRTRTASRRDELREPIRDDAFAARGYRANERSLDRDRRLDDDHGRPERRLEDPRTWFGGGRHEPDADRYAREDRYEPPHRDQRGYDPDERIWREISEKMADDRRLDPRDIEIDVRGGEVTLRGIVEDRDQKRRAEDLAEIPGVIDVHNQLRIRNRSAGDRTGPSWRRGFGLSG